MITTRSVLVLGAGASKDYEFPTALELKKNILHSLRGEEIPDFKQLLNLGFSTKEIVDFRHDLAHSGKLSVDAFLEYREEFTQVGKAAIAQELIKSEQVSFFFKNEPNWYQRFYYSLNTTFDNFDRNQFAVITFNYDRSFEYYLFVALKNSYGKSDDEVARKLDKIPIVHVHGQLGFLPWAGDNSRDYADTRNTGEVKIAAEESRSFTTRT
jgi:hypothetical protein